MSEPGVLAHPATRERWDDLVRVLGPQGGYRGCWCLYWRRKRSELEELGVEGRKSALRELTGQDRPPGILFYDAGTVDPLGWCSLGPREDYPVLERSPVAKRVDDLPTWSIVCFFLREPHRGKGLFRQLVPLAVDHARRCGAARLEVYPRERHRAGTLACMGVAEVYRSLGFREIARRKDDRPVLRLEL